MLRRHFTACLLRPNDVPPSNPDLEVIGVFNPGAIALPDGRVLLLIRVAERPREGRPGQIGLPRWDVATHRVVTDWTPSEELELEDVRVVRRRRDNLVRLNFISHLRVFWSTDGRRLDPGEGASFFPNCLEEEFGVEDARITRIENTYYITYVAVSRHGVTTALASTRDFQTFERHGIIFHPENKDVLLFPERIQGSYYALHRPNPATPFAKPEMWLARSSDLRHWGHHQPLLGGRGTWALGRVGGGTPPLRTERGWLEIYHGNNKQTAADGIGVYSAAAVLLDSRNPARIVGSSPQFFVPEEPFEREGFVPNVVFPTGIVERDNALLVYYGAADTYTGVVEFARDELLNTVAPV